MKENRLLSGDKNPSEEDLKKLPVDGSAKLAHVALPRFCRAYPISDFRSMEAEGLRAGAVGKDLKKVSYLMFRLWHRFKKPT